MQMPESFLQLAGDNPAVVELPLLVLALVFMVRWPRAAALLVGAVACLARYSLGSGGVDGPLTVGRHTMKAAIFSPGSEHDVKISPDVPVPSPASHEMLIQVLGAALNPSNFKVIMARIPFVRHARGGRHVVGYDVSGIALYVGESDLCRGFAVGDEVFGIASSGSVAEFAVVSCERAARTPSVLSPVEAAALPVVALTSMVALERGALSKGDSLLVIGASGGCGIYGVLLAKLRGAHVVGICSTANLDFAAGLGAEVVDYRSTESMAALFARGAIFDVIFDTVSSPSEVDPDYEPEMARLLRKGGRYVAINGQPLDWVRAIVSALIGVNVQRQGYDLFLTVPQRTMLEELGRLHDTRDLPAPTIDRTFEAFSPAQLDAAFARLKSRRAVGKVVFEFPRPGISS